MRYIKINDKHSSHLNSKVPYKFNYPQIYKNNNFDKYIIKWKNILFYLTKKNKKYLYIINL